MIEQDFVVYKVFEVISAQGVFLKIEVKGTHWVCSRLVVWEVQLLQIRVLECLSNGDSLVWIVS